MKKLALIVVVLFAYASCANATGVTKKTSELQQLKQMITSLKNKLTSSHHKQNKLQDQLKTNETAAGKLSVSVKITKRELAQQQQQLKKLQQQQNSYRQQLLTQQKDLAKQMQTIYMLGKQAYLKMLLNHENPNELSRIFIYYNYMQAARIKTIDEIKITLKQLQRTQAAITKKTKTLAQLHTSQQHKYNKLQQSKRQRQSLLTSINRDIKTQKQKLDKLVDNQKNLEKVIARLKASEISPVFATQIGGKQKLKWPTKGKISYLFGQQIGHSELKWDGDIIYASTGENVYAIANGKVVFAQWLQGYGLLVIIDHGHHYMSLYGRNSSLYKKVGDVVRAGDLVATVGNSGGYDKPGLYFAIRHNGKPVNPKLWCRG